MKINTEQCTGRDLKPGDLFSIAGPDYWAGFETRHGIGEKVYIRTEEPCDNAPDADAKVFRITIEL